MNKKTWIIYLVIILVIIATSVILFEYRKSTGKIVYKDTSNDFRFTLPAEAIYLNTGEKFQDDVVPTSGPFQFTLENYPFTGPDTSPYFDLTIETLENPSVSVEQYFESTLRDFYPTEITKETKTIGDFNWLLVCSKTQPANQCGAYTSLANNKIMEFTYNVQKTSSAAADFSKTYNTMLTSFRLL
ncbi:MAG: hypothetical protein PHH01_02025 [Patescibacteria group bacterium]|nr:hypothetical protein [Patescibacteria group bacterium]MDD5566949.1 hypothetical protein [Patescibacteria group bacterium]